VDAGTADAGGTDAGALDSGAVDSGVVDSGVTDAGTPDAGPSYVLPSCLGTSLPLIQSGQIPFITVKVGAAPGAPGAFLIDFASTGSWIDLAGFTPTAPAPTSCQGNPSIPGAVCKFADFDFFGPWGQVTLTTADYTGFNNPRECGLIGTDFLSLIPTTLDFAGHQVLSAKTANFCTGAVLADAGFAPLSTAGYFSNNLNDLVPLITVIPDGGAGVSGYTVPNVPTVKLRLAGVDALAQLDTGFNDKLVPHAININEAYLQALQTSAPGALVRDTSIDTNISTCVGLTENVDGYRLAAGKSAAFVSESGALVQVEPRAVVFVKHTPAAAKACGGIGTWTVPAAQMGGSFMVEAKAVVFDPFAHRVWVPR
jgi:hypothetical protein